jgi:putative flippase GtrA
VDIAIPVLNEERALRGCVHTLHSYLSGSLLPAWRITIVDNGSTDRTWQVAQDLSAELTGVFARRVETRGKGAAIKAAWQNSPAEIVAYMDADLSTGLQALLPLIASLVSGHSEIAIGTRLAGGARTRRSARRELVSRCYNGLLRMAFGARFTDSSCGFKAARAAAVRPLLDKIVDDQWFFDTELLLLAESNGLRVHEVPVDWVEDVDSRVRFWDTTTCDLRGLMRLARAMSRGDVVADVEAHPALCTVHPDPVLATPRAVMWRKLMWFAGIGAASTVVHCGIYALLRSLWSLPWANLFAFVVTAMLNTEANRRWTFNKAGGPRHRLHLRSGALLAAYYLFSTAAVTVVTDMGRLGRIGEITTLVIAYATLTVLRFVALDRWVFNRSRPEAGLPEEPVRLPAGN